MQVLITSLAVFWEMLCSVRLMVPLCAGVWEALSRYRVSGTLLMANVSAASVTVLPISAVAGDTAKVLMARST